MKWKIASFSQEKVVYIIIIIIITKVFGKKNFFLEVDMLIWKTFQIYIQQ